MTIEHLRWKGHFKRPAKSREKFNNGGRTIKNVLKISINVKNEALENRYSRIKKWLQEKKQILFVTLAERKSSYYIAVLLPDRKEEHITPVIIKVLKEFPDEMLKTITFDREKEFSGY